MGFLPNSLPTSVSSIKEQISKATEQSTGFMSGDNAVSDALQPIARIAQKAQTFIELSLMGRGITVQRFSSAKPGKNWILNFPYRFLVTRVNKEGRHAMVAEYRLPINPQQLKVTSPFAIKGTVTSGGFMEEHNGVPIKRIQITGTTGIYLERSSGGREEKRTDVLGTIFGGTIEAANNAVSQVKQASKALGFGSNSLNSVQEEPELTRTGYYQFQMLDLFIHTYVEAKAAPGGQDLRLIFEMAKDNVAYLVTPQVFGKDRNVGSPMEYFYTIDLLAWGTVPDFKGAAPIPSAQLQMNQDVGDLRRALNTLRNLRKVVQSFKNIVSAVRADVESNIFGPVNDVILLTKDILSVPLTIADLPKSLRDSLQTSVVANWESLSATNEDLKRLFGTKMQSIINEGSGASSYIGAPTGQAGQSAATATFKSDVFDGVDLTDNVELNKLELTENQTDAVNAAIADAKDVTINEINTLIAELGALNDALEPQIADKNALDEEWDLLYTINDTVNELYGFIANGNLNNSRSSNEDSDSNPVLATTAMAFWQGVSEDAGLVFNQPQSKFSVPFPFGATLEQVAFVYLGDSTRWAEIAALNGLQYPYVDEVGFTYSLIGNGSRNQLNVTSADNLFVGQTIYISSNTELTTKRKIQAIAEVSATNFLLTVDGEQDLEKYQTADNAQIKAFLPYTVNSMKQIFIPVDTPSALEDTETPPITFLNEDIDLIEFSKIDWLLTPSGDLAITPDGFANLAFGKTNLVQAAKMKLKTPPGSLLLYPGYGAGVPVGTSFADVNLEDQAKRIDGSFREDPRFLSPSKIEIAAEPGVLKEQVVAVVSQGDGLLPITVPLSEKS